MPKLFTPVRAGALSLGHRVVMAPLTRMRAGPGDRPSALMRDYYTQRASAGGLIVSEATPISRQGYGYAGAPGIYGLNRVRRLAPPNACWSTSSRFSHPAA